MDMWGCITKLMKNVNNYEQSVVALSIKWYRENILRWYACVQEGQQIFWKVHELELNMRGIQWDKGNFTFVIVSVLRKMVIFMDITLH